MKRGDSSGRWQLDECKARVKEAVGALSGPNDLKKRVEGA
jgi:hypothetical protein